MAKPHKGKTPKQALIDMQEERKNKRYASGLDFRVDIRQSEKWLRSRNYQLYLQSEEWSTKRKLVFERDEHKCVFCDSSASHVHHTSYDRIFNESLYDLASVCVKCHEALHDETGR